MGHPDRGPTVTDDEILSVVANHDEERLRPGEIADDLPIPEHVLRERLDDLYERDLVDVSEDDVAGEQWRLTDDGRDLAQVPEEEVETDVEAQATKTTGTETTPLEDETPESPPPDPGTDPAGPLPDSPTEEIEAFVGAETPEVEQQRREALRAVYAYLRRHGPATRDDLETDVFSSERGGYQRPEDWWDDLVRPGLDTLPGVTRQETEDAWRFTGGQEAPSSE